jgi:hypothetical protein
VDLNRHHVASAPRDDLQIRHESRHNVIAYEVGETFFEIVREHAIRLSLSKRKTSVWDSNHAICAKALTMFALRDVARQRASPVLKGSRNQNAHRLAASGVGVFVRKWLGVRDDFRNYLITAA